MEDISREQLSVLNQLERSIVKELGTYYKFVGVPDLLDKLEGAVSVLLSFDVWEQLIEDKVFCSMVLTLGDDTSGLILGDPNYLWGFFRDTRLLVDYLPQTDVEPNTVIIVSRNTLNTNVVTELSV